MVQYVSISSSMGIVKMVLNGYNLEDKELEYEVSILDLILIFKILMSFDDHRLLTVSCWSIWSIILFSRKLFPFLPSSSHTIIQSISDISFLHPFFIIHGYYMNI